MPLVFDDEKNPASPSLVFDDEQAASISLDKAPERTWAQVAGDSAIDLAKGTVGLGESAVGLADLATGNLVGQGLGAVGFDPARTKQMMSEGYSDPRQQANRNVSDAKGFWNTAGALVENPSAAVGSMVESAPMMIGTAGAARWAAAKMLSAAGITAGTADAAAFLAKPSVIAKLTGIGSATEGALAAGSIQEQGRQAGRDYTDTAPAAIAGGAITGAIGFVTSKIPGFKDAEVSAAIAGMGKQTTRQTLLETGKEIAKGTFKEGVLEELPQSAQEQVFTNLALGKPWGEGVPEAAAQGMVAGAGMGGGMSTYSAGRNALTQGADPAANPVIGIPISPATNPTVNATQAPQATAAEKALLTPVGLTALDRVSEIDQQIAPLADRLAELNNPTSGYGPMFDQERQDLSSQKLALDTERTDLAKDWPTAVPGLPSSFTTEAGARVEAKYALMDAADLITSHDESLRKNPLYPPELQPRERDRAASEMQVSGIVQKLDPARLGLSADAANGAPIVGADGLVESGNARTIALKRVYQANGQKAADYKQFLVDNAAQFGITPESVNTMAKPVLVRVRSTPVNRAEFARQANASTVAAMSPSEQAKSDSSRIDSMEDLTPDENGDFSNAASRPFVQRFMARLPMTEQAGMMDASGKLSTAGYARVRNAVLAKAYGDSPVLQRMTESMDDNLRNVSRAFVLAAPKVASMRAAVKDGSRFDADITPDLMMAAEELSRIKGDGGSVADALAQTDLMGEQRSPEASQLLQFLNDNMRRPRRMADFIGAYMDALDSAGDPNQGSLLGEVLAPKKQDLLTAAGKATQNEVQDTGAKDARPGSQAGAQDGSQSGNAPRSERSDQNNGPAAAKPAAVNAGRSDPGPVSTDWVDFHPDTGAMGVPRAKMPQVKADKRPELYKFLQSKGIEHTRAFAKAGTLKPTQAEYSPAKAERAKVLDGPKAVVLVSSDGYILDGHHRWVARAANNDPVDVVRFNAPIGKLLEAVREFPGATTSNESAVSPAQPAVSRDQHVENFKAALGDLAEIASKHTRAAMIQEDAPHLMPVLVKLFDSAIGIVGTDIKKAIAHVKAAMKTHPDLKAFWNKIKPETYQKAAMQALENPPQAAQDDLFAAPVAPAQGGLFDGAPAAAPAPKVAMIKGRAYDMKRDNFEPPSPASFLAPDVLSQANTFVKKYFTEQEHPMSAAEREEAALLLEPNVAKAEAVKVDYDQKIIDIAKRTKAIGQMLAPVKGLKRAAEKMWDDSLAQKRPMDPADVKDLLRSTIVVSSYDDAQAIVDEIGKEFEVLRIKNNTTPERRAVLGGYADYAMNVRLPNGVIAEIQINVPAMLAAKENQGHKLFEAARSLESSNPLKAEIYASMQSIYDLVFDLAANSRADLAAASKPAGDEFSVTPPLEGSDLTSRKSSPSSDSLKTLPSGKDTYSSPPKVGTNTQPGGNLSGTFISPSFNSSVAEKTVKGYTGTAPTGENNVNDTNSVAGDQTQGATTAPGTAGEGGTEPVRGGSGRTNSGKRGDRGTQNSGAPRVQPTAQDGSNEGGGRDEHGGITGAGGRAGANAGIPAGRDIPPKSGLNYAFGDDDLTYKGSWVQKATQNIEAVELIKKLQTENRQATREEQTKLAQFIGWGSSELANNLFGDKLNKVEKALQEYQFAVAQFDRNDGRPLSQRSAGFYNAFAVLQSAAKAPLNYYAVQSITRQELDAAKPDTAAVRWLALRDRLKASMTEAEWADAARSTQNAHYTSKPIVKSMWRAMERMGFKGGHVLEPGSGIGVFPGLMPSSMAANSSYTGIEFDAITGAILKQLFPDERILLESFFDSKLPKNFYDVGAGNPPFANFQVLSDPEYKKHAFSLHDYFFAKSIDRIKPGGLVMFVTSRYTMDKLDDKARAYLSERADLVGAIRLPQTAFKQNAGTDVVTDVLFLRKKVKGETFDQAKAWGKSVPMKVGAKSYPINEYFHAHPEMVLGTPSDTGKMANSPEPQYTVLATAGDIEAMFDKAVEALPANIYHAERGSSAEAAQVREIDFNPKAKKEGNYYLTDAGVLMQREDGVGQRVDLKSPKDVALVKDFVPLRDALKQAHYDQLNNGDWETSLAKLQTEYAAFVEKNGQISQYTLRTSKQKSVDEETGEEFVDEISTKVFTLDKKLRDDPDWTLVQALENVNDDTGAITPSDFLTKRVLEKAAVRNVSTPIDALLTTLNDIGKVDIDLIGERVGLSRDEAIEALGTAVYQDPEGDWVTADDYLSGNVKHKLVLARAAAKSDRRYERNIDALLAVQPAPLAPSQIDPNIGMNWIPSEVYENFISEITEGQVDASIAWQTATKSWHVAANRGQHTMAATADWGTGARNVVELMEHALKGSPIRVTRTEGSGADKKVVFDSAATQAALQKLEDLQTKFRSWVFTDPARTDKLVTIYNDNFNTTVPRSFNGSHLTLPGSSTSFSIFDHVKRGAWRIIQRGNTYLAHAVGSGKTFQMVISAMEMKRLGLVKKPMMVVPNHMLKQFASEWQQLYPAARLMVADETNFHTDNRRRFVSRVALSDLDGVVITHSAFKLMDLDPAFKAKMIEEELVYLRAALVEAGGKPDDMGKSRDPKIKRIENQVQKREEQLKATMSSEGKDKNARFDELGVDFLYVDEAHEFRKLDFATTRQVKGIDPMGSARAFDLYMKSRYLEEKMPGRSMVLASGTPITNTMAEMYTVQKLMDRQAMIDKNVDDFDSWAAMFGRTKKALESGASGAYDLVERFSDFANVPELTQMFREFADVLTSDNLGSLLGDERPKVKNGTRTNVVTPKTDQYAAFQQQDLVPRFEASKKWKPSRDEPSNPDPIIAIMADARLAAIDMRFMEPSLPNDPDSKLNRLADDVIAKFKETADLEYLGKDKKDAAGKKIKGSGDMEPNKGAAMMVFADQGFGAGVAANRGFSARAWFEKRLRDAGIPMDQVAFMSDYKKSEAKQKLFRDVNAGRIRVLVGSSKNMGTGVNAQQRLKVMFHLDAPWFPADLEQREGRIIRTGNKNPLVEIYAYAAKGSYDQNLWAGLARKQLFIDKALSGDASVRNIEDMGAASLMDQMSATIAEDPRVLQLAGISADIAKYQRLYQAHEDARLKFHQQYMMAQATVLFNETKMPQAEADAAKSKDLSGDKFTAKVLGQAFADRTKWAESLIAQFKQRADRADGQKLTVGEISGFPITYTAETVAGIFRPSLRLETPSLVELVTDAGTSPMGVAMRAQNAVVEVARLPEKMRERIAQAKSEIDALQNRLQAPFQFAQAMADAIQERGELLADLARVDEPSAPAEPGTGWEDFMALHDPMESMRQGEAPESGAVILDPKTRTRLSRGLGGGMALADLTTLAAKIKARMPNMPKVHVLASPAEAPKALRDYVVKQGAMHDAEGALHHGELYLFASGMSDALRAEHVLAEHEAAHFGLHAILGDSLKAVMQSIYNNNADVRQAAIALQARGKLTNAEAAEEVIVDIPSAQLVKLQGWRKLVLQAHDWLEAHGFDNMAAKLSNWLNGNLDDQQRADLYVAGLVRNARAFAAGKKHAVKKQKASTSLSDTKLSGTLAEDWVKQEQWLATEARARGYKDIDTLAEENYPLFEKLAELWRQKNPATDGVLLSRATPQGTAAERADKIIQTKAATAKPVDAMVRAITQVSGIERLTKAIYGRAGYLLDRYTPEMIKAGMMSDYGVPEAVIDQRAMMQGRQRVQLRQAGSLIDKLSTLTRAESRVAYEWMNETDPHTIYTMIQNLPEESVKVLMEVQAMVDRLSKEAVRMGQLTQDAYDRNKFAYLRRSYAKYTLGQTAGEKAGRARAISILGDQYKGRGMTESATMAQIQNSAPEWWERKLAKGKADTALKGAQLIRLERHAPSGERTIPLNGMEGKQTGKLKEVHYFPAGESLPAKYADWTQAGTFEVRDTKGANAILWRDFTKDERQNMGEIDEARFAIAKTLHAMVHDVEVGRYLEWLAHNYAKKEGETIPGAVVNASERYADTFKPGEWVKVPDSKIQGTGVAKYGTLAGRYLPGPVWNDLRQTVNGQFKPFGDTYSKLLSFWKTSKTALSPAVHMNNVMSNFVMADWHDVTAGHTAKALRIILGAHGLDGKGVLGSAGNAVARTVGASDREASREIMNRYLDSGGNIGSWATNEVANKQIEPLLAAMEAELAATGGQSQQAQVGVMSAMQHLLMLRLPSAYEAMKGSKPGKAVGTEASTIMDLYQNEDEVFRLASWLKSKEEGKTDMEAGKIARRSFMDYNINAPWVQALRNSALPFVSYSYRAVPMMMEIAANKPHKLMKLMLLAGALNALGVMLSGGDDDKERKLLPEEKAGRIWGMVPKLIRMPWNDANHSPVYLDIRRFIPVGDVLDVGSNHSAIPLLPMMTPGGPLVMLGEVLLNKTGFTGKPITLETDTAAQQVVKVMDYLYKAFMPNVLGLPGTYASTGVFNAINGKTDAFGREQSTAQAMASAFGVKLASYPADVLRKNEMSKAQAQMMEIDRNISALKRQRQNKSISDDDFGKQVTVEYEKKRDVQIALQKKLGG